MKKKILCPAFSIDPKVYEKKFKITNTIIKNTFLDFETTPATTHKNS